MSTTKLLPLPLLLLGATVLAQTPISVTVNGQPVQFPNGRPTQMNGRVLVPLRGVFEKMGAFVEWNPRAKTVDATKDTTVVQLHIGDRQALVNGNTVMLDVPPRIVRGSTMVPLRFVSESLGANVQWVATDNLVAITTGAGGANAVQVEHRTMRATLHRNSVIPVTLVDPLSSDSNHAGDAFSAVVKTNGPNGYGGLPDGTRIAGHVVMAKPQSGSDPGVLQVAFDTVQLPDGTTAPLNGSLVSLDANSVTTGSDGILQAKPGKATSNNPLVFVGYGAGAGAVIGMLTKGNVLTDTVIGGALGLLVNELDKAKNKPSNVHLAAGTSMGVRLNQPLNL